jgi:hypothetical protein
MKQHRYVFVHASRELRNCIDLIKLSKDWNKCGTSSHYMMLFFTLSKLETQNLPNEIIFSILSFNDERELCNRCEKHSTLGFPSNTEAIRRLNKNRFYLYCTNCENEYDNLEYVTSGDDGEFSED